MKLRNMLLLGALAIASANFAPSAYAQSEILDQIIPSAEYQSADLREALRALFKQVNANYSIAPDIQGQVTISMKNAKFELVLQNVLAQVGATYRYEGGVFIIVKKEVVSGGTTTPDVAPPATTTRGIVRKIYIRSADPALIALLIGSTSQNYSGSPEPTSLGRMSQGG
ncbi:MAG TPA: hypothetical protein VK171_05170, partial [Fimbriimonas sp.]|nr:hypothetical protein [Fimbriimonas sp.]